MTLQKTAGNSSSSFIDDKLSKFLSSVKQKDVSKVVDENGEPLVVYHGTSAEFNVFDTAFENNGKMLGDGFYLTNSKNKADNYGNKRMQLYANIKVPFILNERNALDEIGRKFEISKEDIQDWLRYYGGNKQQVINRIFREYNLTNKLKEKGYDGVIYNYGSEIVAFKPNQIKSATDNVGTFDSANDDIRFSYNETRTQEEIDELNTKFRDLYGQYKNGDQEAYKQAVELVKAEAERKGYVVEVYHGTGADGFNVADATSSHEENGEGNQAHGAGLYMAVSRDTARGYRDDAVANAKEKMLSHLKIKGLPLSDILNWKILIDENQEVLKIMFSEMVNTPYIFSFDEYIEIQKDWIKKSNNDYDRAIHNQAKEAIETVKKLSKKKG